MHYTLALPIHTTRVNSQSGRDEQTRDATGQQSFRKIQTELGTTLQEEHTDEYEKEAFLRELIREISYIKSGAGHIENFVPSSVSPLEFRTLFHSYQKELRKHGKIDFDDMILLCLNLLRERNDILRYWQSRYPFILVDEFQDISPLQYEIVNLLAKPENNLFVVGDDDQSIYSFRGARPDLMKRFLKDHRKAKVITLRINYRCAPKILEASQAVIRQNRNRFEKKQVSSKNKNFEGSVGVFSCRDPYSQYTEDLDLNRICNYGQYVQRKHSES